MINSYDFEFAGRVEEYPIRSSHDFDCYHYRCGQCNVQVQVPSGEPSFECAGCGTSYRMNHEGRVYRRKGTGQVATTAPALPTASAVVEKKGLVARTLDLLQDVNEEAHGRRLRSDLESTKASISGLESWVLERAMAAFVSRRSAMLGELPNWSIDGRIKIGRELQELARRKFDFDLAEAHGLWMAGAWIESGARRSADARFVHDFLNTLARELGS